MYTTGRASWLEMNGEIPKARACETRGLSACRVARSHGPHARETSFFDFRPMRHEPYSIGESDGRAIAVTAVDKETLQVDKST